MEIAKVAKGLLFLFIAISVTFALFAAPVWQGSLLDFLIFNITFIIMVALVFFGPQSYVYGFFSIFLFLGFWGKMIFHLVFASQFIEPVGGFDGSVAAWEMVIQAATAAAAAVALARLVQIRFFSDRSVFKSIGEEIPFFYVQWRIGLWLTALTSMAFVYAWNQYASFYQIGVNPRLVLPMHLNVLMAWLINWGFAFIFATLAYWEILHSEKRDVLVIVFLLFVAFVASVSTLSRSVYLFQGFAFCLAWYSMTFQRKRLRNVLLISSVFVIGLGVSLVLVQAQRAEKFLDRVSIESVSDAQESALKVSSQKHLLAEQKRDNVYQFIAQVPYLFISRWIGLDALMAVSAYPDRGRSALGEAIFDDPRMGVSSFFQRVANAKYGESEKFTFLTLAGPVALFSFSGSLLVIGIAMLLLTGLLLFFEIAIRRWVGNPFVICLAGVAMAYTVSQATFLYLTLIFFGAGISTVAMIWFVQYCSNSKFARYGNSPRN